MTVRIASTGDSERPKYGFWPKYAQRSSGEEKCICPFVDVGVGVMQHGVDPDCPVCNPHPERLCTCSDWAPVLFENWLRYPRLFGSWPYHLDETRPGYVVPREGTEIDPCCTIHGE
jgi:hypothetical protein